MHISSSSEPLGHIQPNLVLIILGWRGFKFVCTNEGPLSFPRGDNYELAKIHWPNFKIFFSNTTGLISTKLGTKHPWAKRILVFSNEGPHPFPRGDDYEIAKMNWLNLKILSSRATRPISTQLGTKHPWVKETQVCLNEGTHFFSKRDNSKNTLTKI